VGIVSPVRRSPDTYHWLRREVDTHASLLSSRQVRDLWAGEILGPLIGHEDTISALVYYEHLDVDGRTLPLLASGSYGGDVIIWRADTLEKVKRWQVRRGEVPFRWRWR
jgi:WD40 repeat protein